MIKPALLVTALLITALPVHASWTTRTETDAITDEINTEASVKNADGDNLTVFRRSNGTVWAFVKLGGLNQFGIEEQLVMRIDKNKPYKIAGEHDKTTALLHSILIRPTVDLNVPRAKVGLIVKPMPEPVDTHNWEWNPDLIGFSITSKDESDKCPILAELRKGNRVVVRYHPNQSTTRDIQFSLKGSTRAITKAVGKPACLSNL